MPSREIGYLVDKAAIKDFARSFALLVAGVNRQELSTLISARNSHRFRHGGSWSHPSSPELSDGHLKRHGVEASTSLEEILQHDLSLLPRILRELSLGFKEQFMRSFYDTVNEACERSGNSVSAKDQGLENALLQMMEKIEFGVGENGEVSMPQIHAAPDMAQRLMELERTGSTEFKARIDAVKERKSEEARVREMARRGRFVEYGKT